MRTPALIQVRGLSTFAYAYLQFYHGDAQVKIENRELQGQEDVFSALMSLLTLSDLEAALH